MLRVFQPSKVAKGLDLGCRYGDSSLIWVVGGMVKVVKMVKVWEITTAKKYRTCGMCGYQIEPGQKYYRKVSNRKVGKHLHCQ